MIDLNAFTGDWPFHNLEYNTPEKLVGLMDAHGIEKAAVSPIEGIFYRNVQEINEKYYESLKNFSDRLIQVAVINPGYIDWERDFDVSINQLKMKAIKIFPYYHNYDFNSVELKKFLNLCKDNSIPVFIPVLIEDPRNRHWLDVRKNVSFRDLYNLIITAPDNTYVIQNAGWQIANALTGTLPLGRYDYYFDMNFVLGPPLDDLEKIYKRVGAERLVFGSGMPFRYPSTGIMKISYCIGNENEQKTIFELNAKKILKL